MPSPVKVQRLKRLTTLADKAHKAQAAADKAMAERDQQMLACREVEPATYQEIAEAAGVTKDRVSQIIGVQRRKR